MKLGSIAFAAILVILGGVAAQPLDAQLALCPQIEGDLHIGSAEDVTTVLGCMVKNVTGGPLEAVLQGVFQGLVQALQAPAPGGTPTPCASGVTIPAMLTNSTQQIPQLVGCLTEFAHANGFASGAAVAIGGLISGEPPGPPDLPAATAVPCAEKMIHASAIRTRDDLVAFVNCAYEYAQEHGTVEASRAFNEDKRWKDGPTYVFVDQLLPDGKGMLQVVFPPDRDSEGKDWGPLVDLFGTDLGEEFHRVARAVGGGWLYYSYRNPATGRDEPKASYGRLINWAGRDAVLGAGLYERDIPGTCDAEEVNAGGVDESQDFGKLEELVRCAAHLVAEQGHFAARALSDETRWRSGSVYVFGLDPQTGALFFTGNRARLNGVHLPEIQGVQDPAGQFRGRDMLAVTRTFGDSHLTYETFNPATGRAEVKVSYLKSVTAQGVPVLVGAGLYFGSPAE